MGNRKLTESQYMFVHIGSNKKLCTSCVLNKIVLLYFFLSVQRSMFEEMKGEYYNLGPGLLSPEGMSQREECSMDFCCSQIFLPFLQSLGKVELRLLFYVEHFVSDSPIISMFFPYAANFSDFQFLENDLFKVAFKKEKLQKTNVPLFDNLLLLSGLVFVQPLLCEEFLLAF